MPKKSRKISSEQKSKLYNKLKEMGGREVPIEQENFVKDDDIQEKIRQIDKIKQEQERAKQEKKTQKVNQDKKRQKDKNNSTKQKPSQTSQKHTNDKKLKKMKHTKKRQNSKKITIYNAKKPDPPFAVNAWVAKMKCVFAGIINIFSLTFSNGFKRSLQKKLPRMLGKAHKILTPILHQNEAFSSEIKRRLKSIGRPYYYELVFRFDNIYNAELLEELQETLTWRNNVKRSEGPIIRLYKKLETLHQYLLVLINALKAVLSLEKEIKNIDSEIVKKNYFYLKKSALKLFKTYYPNLELLMRYYFEKAKEKNKKLSFEKFIKHQQSDEMGYYTKIWREQKEFEEKREKIQEQIQSHKQEIEQDKQKEKNKLMDQIRNGLKITYHNVDFSGFLKAMRISRDPLGGLDIKDKAFIILTLLEFFYRHYSVLFLSGDVEYNIITDFDGKKLDVESKMKETYYQFNALYKRFREYMRIVNQIKGLEDLKDQSNINAANVNKLINQRQELLKIINYEARNNLKTFNNSFRQIIKNAGTDNKIIIHPEQLITTKTKNEKGSYNEGKTVLEAVKEATDFLIAMEFLLTEGDLDTSGYHLENPRYIQLQSKPNSKKNISSAGNSK